MLTDNEKQFLGALEGVRTNSIWGISINEVLKNPEPVTVRKLIRELKSQASDCYEIALSIIGEPGMRQLQNL